MEGMTLEDNTLGRKQDSARATISKCQQLQMLARELRKPLMFMMAGGCGCAARRGSSKCRSWGQPILQTSDQTFVLQRRKGNKGRAAIKARLSLKVDHTHAFLSMRRIVAPPPKPQLQIRRIAAPKWGQPILQPS